VISFLPGRLKWSLLPKEGATVIHSLFVGRTYYLAIEKQAFYHWAIAALHSVASEEKTHVWAERTFCMKQQLKPTNKKSWIHPYWGTSCFITNTSRERNTVDTSRFGAFSNSERTTTRAVAYSCGDTVRSRYAKKAKVFSWWSRCDMKDHRTLHNPIAEIAYLFRNFRSRWDYIGKSLTTPLLAKTNRSPWWPYPDF